MAGPENAAFSPVRQLAPAPCPASHVLRGEGDSEDRTWIAPRMAHQSIKDLRFRGRGGCTRGPQGWRSIQVDAHICCFQLAELAHGTNFRRLRALLRWPVRKSVPTKQNQGQDLLESFKNVKSRPVSASSWPWVAPRSPWRVTTSCRRGSRSPRSLS